MKNTWDQNLPNDVQEAIKTMVEHFEMDGFEISYEAIGRKLHFKHGFKVATILIDLVKNERWSDLRHILRATLGSSPQLNNYHADGNEWVRNWRE